MVEFLLSLMHFIVSVSFDLIIYLVLFYFLIELAGTHAYHPIRQAILRYTQPLIDPIHKAFPVYRNVDSGLIFLLIVLEIIKLSLMFILAWKFPNLALLFVWSIFLIFNATLNLFVILLLFRLLISWIIPIYSNHPASQLLFLLTEPILRPIRHRFSTIKGFDWTPIAAIVGLKIISILVGYALALFGAPPFIL